MAANPMPIRPQLLKLKELDHEMDMIEHRRYKVLSFMETAPYICFMKDAENGRYQFMSRRGCDALGKSEEEIIGRTDWELFPEEMARRMIGHDLKVLQTRQRVVAIELHSYKQGNPGLYLVSKFLVVNGEESIGGLAIELPDTFKMESIE